MTTRSTLRAVRPFLERMRDNEYVKRTMLSDLGVKSAERIVLKTKKQDQEDEYECEICSENLYVSYVSNEGLACSLQHFYSNCAIVLPSFFQMCDVKEDTYYCMQHAIEYLQEKKITQRKHCKLLYTHSKEEISAVIKAVNRRLNASDESSSSSDEDERLAGVKRSYTKRATGSAMSSESVLAASTSFSAKGKAGPGVGMGKRKYSVTRDAASAAAAAAARDSDEEITFNVGKSAKIRRKEQEEKFQKKISKPIARREETPPPSTSGTGKKSSSKKSSPTEKRKSSGKAEKEPPKKKATAASKKKAEKAPSEKREVVKRRKTKTRKAAQDKHGNLTVEILDMLLSASEDESGEDDEDDDNSDESWK